MAFTPAENTVKVELNYTSQGQKCANIIYIQLPNPPVPTDLIDVAAAVATWWSARMAPLTCAGTSLDNVTCTDLTVANSYQIVYTSGLPDLGSRGVNPVPNNATVVTKFHTSLSGRSFRGRSYFVGLELGDLTGDANHVDSAFAIDLAEAWELLITDIDPTHGVWVVASFYSGVDGDGKPIPRSEAVMTPIIACSTDTTVDSQRRRLPGRGL